MFHATRLTASGLLFALFFDIICSPALVSADTSIPKYPKASAELRWMMPGSISDSGVEAWFAALQDDGPADPPTESQIQRIVDQPLAKLSLQVEPPRLDFYYIPTDRDLGIKIRGPSETNLGSSEQQFVMEIKRIARTAHGPSRLPITISRGKQNGTIETWNKWSLIAVEQPPPNFASLTSNSSEPDPDTSDLVSIRKTRSMKTFMCHQTTIPISIELELSSLTLQMGSTSSKQFWSLAFESANPDRATSKGIPGGFATLRRCLEAVARKRVFRGFPGEPSFSAESSMGYAEWLIGVLDGF